MSVRRLPFVLVVALAASCGTAAGVPDEAMTTAEVLDADAPEAAGELPGVEAIETAFDEAGGTDDTADATDVPPAEVAAELPPHTAVFEQKTHPTCRKDGPYDVDRVAMVRGAAQLADLDVRTALVTQDAAWLGTSTGLFKGADAQATFTQVPLPDPEAPVADLDVAENGDLLVAHGNALRRLDSTGKALGSWDAGAPVTRTFWCNGGAFAIAAGTVRVTLGADLVAITPQPPGGAVHDGACLDGDPGPRLATDTGLWGNGESGWNDLLKDVAKPGPVTRVAARGSHLVAAVGDALYVHPGVLVPAGPGGLPEGAITSLDVSDDGTVAAVGHAIGATRVALAGPPVVDHFVSQRWLPADDVRAVALGRGAAPALWVATTEGAARLEKAPTTLQDKAGRMMDQLDRWFWRLGGFVDANAVFPDAGSDGPPILPDDDNDGQWTQEAVGAFCYAYQVTHDERWYQAAKKAITNMAMQIDLPAADFVKAGLGRGFITRSFVRDDEGDVFTSKATLGNWHLVPWTDGHDYYWKDDTSSDELTGHFYGFSIYWDLCAKDDAEKTWVAEHLTALVGSILDHGFKLLDLGGKPTTYGDYSPQRIPIAVDGLEACVNAGYDLVACMDVWAGSQFLDSVEILGGMLAAWHVSGEARFLDAYESLIAQRYGDCAMFNTNMVTWVTTQSANYCDHELADLAFLTLLRYEPHPERRAKWVESMLAAYDWEKGERNPLKALAMIAAVQDPPGVDEGVRTLVEYPEDLRQVRVDNQHRVDYELGGNDRFGDPQFKVAPPYDEMAVKRWDSNPYAVVDGDNASVRRAPNFWLLPYWGLRYYGAICP